MTSMQFRLKYQVLNSRSVAGVSEVKGRCPPFFFSVRASSELPETIRLAPRRLNVALAINLHEKSHLLSVSERR